MNRILRDHQGYTGDGKGGDGALPVGDRSTARKPIDTRDLREVFIPLAESADSLSDAVGEAEQFANDAGALVSEAEFAASQSADNAATAGNYASDAQTAAEVSGDVLFFDTKADATADLGGLAEGQIVRIFADESQGGMQEFYRVESAVLVHKPVLKAKKTIHLDTLNGSDVSVGILPGSPVASAARALALLNDGDNLYIARNSVVYAGSFPGKKYITVRAYGSGRRPIFTAAKAINGTWSAVGGYTDVYKTTVVHDTQTQGSTDAAFYPQFSMWDDEGDSYLPARICGLERITADKPTSNRALATDLAALTPGSFTVRRTGADDESPYTVDATSFDYYVRLKDGADPAALTNRTIRYAEQKSTAAFGFGCDIEGIDFLRSASKDHVSGGLGKGSVGRMHDVRCVDATVHGSVVRCSTYTKYYAEKNPYTSMAEAGNGLHLYRGTDIDGISRGAWCDDVEVVGFNAGVSCHDEGPGNASAFEQWQMGRIVTRNCAAAFAALEVNTHIHVKSLHVDGGAANLTASGQRGVFQDAASLNAGCNVTIDDFSFYGDEEELGNITAVSGNIHIKNGWAYVPDAPSGSPVRSLISGGSGNASTTTLENFTNLNGPIFATTFSANVTLNATDCVLGELGAPAAAVNASNCYVSNGADTLDEIQAVYAGIGDTCLVPFYDQPYQHTFDAGEISTESSGTANMTSGAGFFLGSRSDLENRYNLIIRGADGSGGDLKVQGVVRDNANDSGGLYAYTCPNIATMPATVTGVAVDAVYSDREIFPITPGTARLYKDQDTVTVSDISQFTPGQLVRIGSVVRREPLGLFTVDSLPAATANGDRVTFTESLGWRMNAIGQAENLRNSDGGYGAYGPTVDLHFGFPIWLDSREPTYGVRGEISYATGGTLDFMANRQYDGGLFDRPAQRGGDYVSPDEGRIPNNLRVGAGDSVSLTARVRVDEWVPEYSGIPSLSRLPVLDRGCECAKRKMGWRYIEAS
jgi:hypothetical protein